MPVLQVLASLIRRRVVLNTHNTVQPSNLLLRLRVTWLKVTLEEGYLSFPILLHNHSKEAMNN